MSREPLPNADDVLDRVKEAKGLSSDTALAQFLEVGNSTPGAWRHRNSPNWDLIFTKCRDEDLNWIVWGEERKEPESTAVLRESRIPYLPDGDTVEVPIYDGTATNGQSNGRNAIVGYGSFLKDWLRYELGIQPDRAFVAPVRGHSMTDLLRDGDLVLGEQVDFLDRNGLFAVRLNGELYVKHVARAQDSVRLISENGVYPPVDVSKDDDLNVLGRVVCKVARL